MNKGDLLSSNITSLSVSLLGFLVFAVGGSARDLGGGIDGLGLTPSSSPIACASAALRVAYQKSTMNRRSRKSSIELSSPIISTICSQVAFASSRLFESLGQIVYSPMTEHDSPESSPPSCRRAFPVGAGAQDSAVVLVVVADRATLDRGTGRLRHVSRDRLHVPVLRRRHGVRGGCVAQLGRLRFAVGWLRRRREGGNSIRADPAMGLDLVLYVVVCGLT